MRRWRWIFADSLEETRLQDADVVAKVVVVSLGSMVFFLKGGQGGCGSHVVFELLDVGFFALAKGTLSGEELSA